MFTLISDEIEDYCEKHSSKEEDILYQLYRETFQKTLRPRMISGHIQGLFLQMISNLVKPKRILELGTFTGYSTICLAKGLTNDGLIYTIEEEPELEYIIHKYLHQTPLYSKVKLMIGKALDIIPSLHETWDIIYIDADKTNYLNYYKILLPSLSKNGILLADNVLWSGKILNHPSSDDKETKALSEFNEYVQNDNNVTNLLLPLRDGIMIVQKI
ncbi:MAG: putative O-methyltransferase [Bacteroidetes bacterium ADurb.Bin234]|nr:MAG: putative O-methyltransferase [Bacteroidetes bacterium ADurb.Bin234]